MSATVKTANLTEAPITDAFAAFISAANRLEHSHLELHKEVRHLRTQLEERNRALAASVLEANRMRVALRNILNALPCGVAVVENKTQDVLLLNPKACSLLGILTAETAQIKDFPTQIREMVFADDLSPQNVSPRPEDEIEFCLEIDGEKRWLAVRYTEMSSASLESGSSAAQTILIFRDTTSQKQIEQERESSRHMLALAEVAAVLAHEIRNPLGSLELIAGVLWKDSGLIGQSKQWVRYLRAGIRSLSATVNNVLRIHSLGTLNLSPVRLDQVLKDAVEFARPLVEQAGLSLTLIGDLSNIRISADAIALQQVLLNLACNAIRHTRKNGEIIVSSTVNELPEGTTAVISFADSGSGIAPEHLANIFEPGFSTGQTPGLGLTVCKRIVEQHKGAITVQSEVGRGTTFRMEFPIL
jgi:two-component system sensor histidine kinase FlrB